MTTVFNVDEKYVRLERIETFNIKVQLTAKQTRYRNTILLSPPNFNGSWHRLAWSTIETHSQMEIWLLQIRFRVVLNSWTASQGTRLLRGLQSPGTVSTSFYKHLPWWTCYLFIISELFGPPWTLNRHHIDNVLSSWAPHLLKCLVQLRSDCRPVYNGSTDTTRKMSSKYYISIQSQAPWPAWKVIIC